MRSADQVSLGMVGLVAGFVIIKAERAIVSEALVAEELTYVAGPS